MGYLLRVLRLLGMVVWVGGLLFFALVEAPAAFHVMGTTRDFALLIGRSVTGINQLGHVSGIVFVFASLLLWRRSSARTRRLIWIEVLLVVLMIAATAFVQLGIVPAMEHDRRILGGNVAAAPADNANRAHFDRLHSVSEKVEGSALILGIAVVLLLAAEDSHRERASVRR